MKQLGKKSVKQIGSDAAQLYFMLYQLGVIDRNEFTNKLAKEHKEIMSMRFHPQRSPTGYLPDDVAQKVYPIFHKYVDGILRYENRKWTNIELSELLNQQSE